MTLSVASEPDWHGWNVDGKTLYVGPLPGRKSVCLYTLENNTIRTLAFFKSERLAQDCLERLDVLATTRIKGRPR